MFMKHVRTHYSTPENVVLKQLTLKASMQKLKRLSSHNKFYQAVSVEKTKFFKRELSGVLLAEGIYLLLLLVHCHYYRLLLLLLSGGREA